jgi:hypothetical protein
VTQTPVIPGISYDYVDTVNPISRDFGEIDKTTTPWTFKNVQFKKPVKITIPFTISDIGALSESLLRIYYFDESAGKFIYQGTERGIYKKVVGTQEIINKTVSTNVDHFSTYRILALAVKNDYDTLLVYPNPFNPATANNKVIKISNLTLDTTMNVYNVAAELVRTINESDYGNLGFLFWDGKNNNAEDLPRGVYFFVLVDQTGHKKTGKIGLVR